MAQDRQENQETQELKITNVATNEVCTKTGPYINGGTPKVIVFVNQGEKFPPSPTLTTSSTTWTLVSGTQANI
jgi:hypothetical protein